MAELTLILHQLFGIGMLYLYNTVLSYSQDKLEIGDIGRYVIRSNMMYL